MTFQIKRLQLTKHYAAVDANLDVANMAIPRKKVVEKIDGYRKAIEYHLDEHIPELIGQADRGLIEYWRKELSARIQELEQWALRLSKNDAILREAAEYRRRLDELLNARLDQIGD